MPNFPSSRQAALQYQSHLAATETSAPGSLEQAQPSGRGDSQLRPRSRAARFCAGLSSMFAPSGSRLSRSSNAPVPEPRTGSSVRSQIEQEGRAQGETAEVRLNNNVQAGKERIESKIETLQRFRARNLELEGLSLPTDIYKDHILAELMVGVDDIQESLAQIRYRLLRIESLAQQDISRARGVQGCITHIQERLEAYFAQEPDLASSVEAQRIRATYRQDFEQLSARTQLSDQGTAVDRYNALRAALAEHFSNFGLDMNGDVAVEVAATSTPAAPQVVQTQNAPAWSALKACAAPAGRFKFGQESCPISYLTWGGHENDAIKQPVVIVNNLSEEPSADWVPDIQPGVWEYEDLKNHLARQQNNPLAPESDANIGMLARLLTPVNS